MALTWDLTDIENYEELLVPYEGEDAKEGDKTLDGITNTLIWLSISTGIGTITEKNWTEVYARVKFLERDGALMNRGGEPVYFTTADVRRRIGLKTNASFKDETRAAFLKKFGTDLDRYKRAAEREEVTA